MSYQDPTGGDTLTTEGASVPPLLGYGADSTLNTSSGGDAIPTSVTTPPGAAPGRGAPEPTGSPQHLGSTVGDEDSDVVRVDVTEIEVDTLDNESWDLRRTGLIAGVVVAGLAAGAGAAWFVISRRRAQQARLAVAQAAQVAQARKLMRMIPAQVQAANARRFLGVLPARSVANATDTGAALTKQAGKSAREASMTAQALAESALAAVQDARDRAIAASLLLRDQTINTSQIAQDRLADTWEAILDTWDKTRDTASTSWGATAQTAKAARAATLRTVDAAREAAMQTADTARAESQRTAKVARSGWRRAQRAATR